jgi:hypothetical protein
MSKKAYLDIIKETGNLFTVYARGLINTLRGFIALIADATTLPEENKIQMSL